jgi:RNA 3'-terminal phosphate cyclase (ATP)
MLTIDGSFGEGGGQILRTALGLSLVTGKPFRIEKIRAGRERPGLLRQHLTAVQAATRIGGADVEGASIGSKELTFTPGKVAPGDYSFAVGTAGSATLVLQTVLPALMTVSEHSTLRLEGGTHNPWAPPFDFLQKSLLPLLGRMGPNVTPTLERRGFYPAGSGKFTVAIEPSPRLSPLELTDRGELQQKRATAIVASLPADIAHRELKVVLRKLEIERPQTRVVEDGDSLGPGNVVLIEIESEYVTEVFTGFGETRIRAEVVADRAVDEARDYLAAGVPVGPHLADQLLVPLALAGSGSFRTMPLTKHATTNIEVIRMFLGTRIDVDRESDTVCRVRVA